MKIAAHPLVVAAALGLLGPKALEGLVEDDGPCLGCPSEDQDDNDAAPADGFGQLDETLFTIEAPSLEEVARIEDAWRKLR